jgi:hypothetical protein
MEGPDRRAPKRTYSTASVTVPRRCSASNTATPEFYATRSCGKIERVVVLRNIWDRSCWLAAEEIMAKLCTRIADLPGPGSSDDEVWVH